MVMQEACMAFNLRVLGEVLNSHLICLWFFVFCALHSCTDVVFLVLLSSSCISAGGYWSAQALLILFWTWFKLEEAILCLCMEKFWSPEGYPLLTPFLWFWTSMFQCSWSLALYVCYLVFCTFYQLVGDTCIFLSFLFLVWLWGFLVRGLGSMADAFIWNHLDDMMKLQMSSFVWLVFVT